MRNDSRVADKVYIKRGCLELQDFLFLLSLLVLLYSKASTTLTQPQLLSCLDPFNTNPEASGPDYNITLQLPISPTSNPACYMKPG